MKESIKKMFLHYAMEIVNGHAKVEDLEGYADNFIEDLQRLIKARKDFKED